MSCVVNVLSRDVSYGTLVGLARTIYIRCVYGNFGREITKYTVIYDAYIRFWPTLRIRILRRIVFDAYFTV
jgi:hypothetical protein